jgi:Ca2+-binding RTX toxin-like protein
MSSIGLILPAYVENLWLSGSDNLWGTGNLRDNIIVGNSGGNTLSGVTGNDSLYGLGGNDLLWGGQGSDAMDGGEGSDTVTYLGSDAGVYADISINLCLYGHATGDTLSNVENLVGSAHDDILVGYTGTNILAGGGGNDTLFGSDDNDVLTGGAGADELNGGTGNDTANYAGGAAAVAVDLAAGTGTGGDAQGDTYFDIEWVTGTDFADTLVGNGADNVLAGGAGADAMSGGAGNDTYFVDNAADTIVELPNEGYDTVNTTLTTFTLGANLERVNSLGAASFVGIGNALDNRFQSLGGDDRFVDVAGGADIFSGGAGTDIVDFRTSATGAVLDFVSNVHSGAAAGDVYASIEKFFGSSTAGDTMTAGGTGRVIYAGYGGDDTLTGGIKNDQLLGGEGGDTLSGGADRDTLDGGTGDDTMTGGSEGDVFVFVDAAFGEDTITDFEDGIDTLKVYSAVADEFADFAVAGNGTNTVILTLLADPANTVTIQGALPITVAADDFVFY